MAGKKFGKGETDMMWYKMNGSDKDVAVSTRVRFARNIVDYPNEPKLAEAGAKEIIKRVSEVFEGKDGWKVIDFSSLSEAGKKSYAERNLVSPEFAGKKTPCALIANEEKNIYIMVLEEDHLRIQCIMPGLDIDKAFANAVEADEMIDAVLTYAYSEKLGYLTHCPTNLGTGMRASVMLYLPAYTQAGAVRSLQNQLGKIGLTIRGMSGENTEASGNLYQISNQITLGISEEDTIRKLSDVIAQIIKQERNLRKKMAGNSEDTENLRNTAMRSLGMLMYSTRLSTSEMLSLYQSIRLGSSLGLTENVKPEMLDEMLFSCMPYTITAENDNIRTASQRDVKRAETAKNILGGAKH